MAKQTNNVYSAQYPSGGVFVGSILIGVAVGLLQNNVAPYALLGVGVGFVLAALFSLTSRNKFLNR